MGDSNPDPPLDIFRERGEPVRPIASNASLLIFLRRERSTHIGEFVVHFTEVAENAKGYIISIPTVESELIVTSAVGDRFFVPGIDAQIQKDSNPCTRTRVDAVLEVLEARGRVDSMVGTVDGNFWRRIAVDVDWSAVGCGLGAVRGRIIFDLTAAFGANCRERFHLVGSSGRRSTRHSRCPTFETGSPFEEAPKEASRRCACSTGRMAWVTLRRLLHRRNREI
jgi:hypothetical protein